VRYIAIKERGPQEGPAVPPPHNSSVTRFSQHFLSSTCGAILGTLFLHFIRVYILLSTNSATLQHGSCSRSSHHPHITPGSPLLEKSSIISSNAFGAYFSLRYISSADTGYLQSDPYYGQKSTARTAANFVFHLFNCPDKQSPEDISVSLPYVRLDIFIAFILCKTGMDESVHYATLYLLRRMKSLYPASMGTCGQRLYLAAYMISAKFLCDDVYTNRIWTKFTQGMFELRVVNQMEREMCAYLDYNFNIAPEVFRDFPDFVKRTYSGPGPYPPLTGKIASAHEPLLSSHVSAAFTTTSTPARARPAARVPSYVPPASSFSLRSAASMAHTVLRTYSHNAPHKSTVLPHAPAHAAHNHIVRTASESRSHQSTRSHHSDNVLVAAMPVARKQPRAHDASIVGQHYAAPAPVYNAISAPGGTRQGTTGIRPVHTAGRDGYVYAPRTAW
jgi:hypothetical protein